MTTNDIRPTYLDSLDEVNQLRAERSDLIDDVVKLRAELEKVRAQLADTQHRAHTDATNLQQILRDKTALANENARLRRQLTDIARLKCWTNEDGKRFIFVTDLQAAMGVPTDKAVAR